MSALVLLACSVQSVAEERLRVVSLAPHLTELAFAAGAGESLVGVVAYSDWPEAARELPRIGDAYRFDMETILGLDADLALAWRGGTPAGVVRQLEDLGIDVLWIETRSLAEIASALERIGSRLGSLETAREAARKYEQQLAALRQQNDEQEGISIFYQVSAHPLFTLGGRHVITQVFEACGARNVFADLDVEAAAIDREAVLARTPELIIAGINEGSNDPLAIWRDTGMVEQGHTRLEAVDPERLVRPTPRILEGIEYVCDLVRDVDAGT
ncbi:cobalamin-binding protein [Wenzhouxiangella sp. XN201]|uniref:cobalamin-binding protein n=1 Tax=Wenzhouxiangella sp. XN201 TaxID=2710755 RepID=UPI0013CD2963|nr:cobalamin-binding protein [Wenzhouxiangella sp. XN201]NEZ04405.1 cobalamin-binding protein [Wenzhouxiangella sp. XN201]